MVPIMLTKYYRMKLVHLEKEKSDSTDRRWILKGDSNTR